MPEPNGSTAKVSDKAAPGTRMASSESQRLTDYRGGDRTITNSVTLPGEDTPVFEGIRRKSTRLVCCERPLVGIEA